MKKSLFALSMAVVFSLAVFGCNQKEETPEETTAVDIVSSASPMNAALAAGGKAVSKDDPAWINAKTLSLSPHAGGVKVDIGFVLGSSRDGMDEASIDYVPAYRAYYLEHPARLVIELDDLSFWSYESALDIPEDSLFYGIFKQPESSTNGFSIIFQLREDADVRVSDEKNVLSLDFSVRPEQDETKYYYVMADAQAEFSTSSIVSGDLFPTLSNDMNNIVLISHPYQTENEAKANLKTLIEKNDVLTENNTFEIGLEGNDLPSYGDQSKFSLVYSQNVIRRNGQPETLPVVMPDGLYLTSTADGSLALFSKQESIPDSEETYDYLWVMDQNGRLKLLYDMDFSNIDQAAFSPDGRRVAFLDKSGDDSLLYVYDLITNEFYDLGEERMGHMTSTFIWDTLGTAIYAISGSDNSQQLRKYDFVVQDEDARLTSVEEQEIGEGDLGFLNGELYFTNITEDNEEIVFKIKPEGGLHTEFARGSSFRISPDGQYMAIIRGAASMHSEDAKSSDEEDGGEDESNNAILLLLNMQTGEEMMVEESAYIVTYEWAPDGKLYYAKSISDDFSSEYSFMLRYYDPSLAQSFDVAEMAPSDFATTPNPNVLYINMIGKDDETPIRATYKFTLS